jgi:hypothetical protein
MDCRFFIRESEREVKIRGLRIMAAAARMPFDRIAFDHIRCPKAETTPHPQQSSRCHVLYSSEQSGIRLGGKGGGNAVPATTVGGVAGS